MTDRKELIDLLRSSQSHTMIEAADEITRLCKYEELVWFIANDYHELSHDKAKWQRDDWKKRCKKLLQEDTLTELMQSDSHLIGDLDF